jgi:hypothetical protein
MVQLITEKDAAIAAVITAKDAIIASKDQDLRDSQRIASFLTGTKSEKAIAIRQTVPVSSFSWQKPDSALVKAAWRAIKADPRVTDSSQHSSENDDTHPAFAAAIRTIIDSLNLPLSLVVRNTLHRPLRIPDIILGQKGILAFSWGDVRISVELKRASVNTTNDAIAEVVEYLNFTLPQRPEHETSEQRNRIGIASDCRTIEFVWTADTLPHLKRTNRFELFPEGWQDLSTPTEGFQVLCHALQVPVALLPIVEIENSFIAISSCLQSSTGSAVYKAQFNKTDLAVKIGTSKYGVGLVAMEGRIYRMLLDHRPLQPYMVPAPPFPAKVTNGFAMQLGFPYMDWCENLQSNNKEDWNVIDGHVRNHTLWLYDGLRTLHKFGWRHGDIRPGNIVLFNGSPRFVDWSTAAELSGNSVRLFLQGSDDPFQPENPDTVVEMGRKWDLYCFGFTMLNFCCADSEFSMAFRDNRRRRGYVNSWSTSSARFASNISRFIEKLYTIAGEVQESEYDALRLLLSSN